LIFFPLFFYFYASEALPVTLYEGKIKNAMNFKKMQDSSVLTTFPQYGIVPRVSIFPILF